MAHLDWLRALAAFAVLYTHARHAVFVDYIDLLPQYRTKLAMAFMLSSRLGDDAVMVFFVLSGFLVGGPLLERARKGVFDWRAYSLDRATRIYLPLLPAIAFTLVVTLLRFGRIDGWQTLGHLVALQQVLVRPFDVDVPLWSLSYEIWFYLIGGALALLYCKFNPAAAAIVLAGVLVFTRLEVAYLAIWCLGAGAYHVRFRRCAAWAAVALLLIGIGIGVDQFAMASRYLPVIGVPQDAAYLVLGCGTAILVSILRELPSSPRVARLASMAAAPSYTIYLIHYPAIALLQMHGLVRAQMTFANFALFIGLLVFLLLVGLAFYWPFERNTKRVRRAVSHWVAVRRVSAGAVPTGEA